jgi:hypothetical protein
MEHCHTANTALGIWNTYFHDPVISNSPHRLGGMAVLPTTTPYYILWDIFGIIPIVTILEMSYIRKKRHAQQPKVSVPTF